MNPAKAALFAGGVATFIGAAGGAQDPPGDIPIPFPSGTRPGDLAFVFVNNSGSAGSVSTAGWSSVIPTGVGGAIWWKRLEAADLTATAHITTIGGGNTLYVMVFRGFGGAAVLTNQGLTVSDGSTSRSWTGATKTSNTRGLLFFMAGNVSSVQTITSPSLANAASYPAAANSAGLYKVRITYDFTSADYISGTAIAETYGSGWDQISLVVFELT